MSYNGWSNRATWNVSLWLNNDEGLYHQLRADIGRAKNAGQLAEYIEELARAVWPDGKTPDGDLLDECDFDEIARGEWGDSEHAEEKNEPTSLNSFIEKNGLIFTAHRVASRPDGLMGDTMRHFRCRITKQGKPARGFGLYFSQGSAHTEAPTLADVLDCLASDASGYENAKVFEDWAREYGYESDSRKAEQIFRATKRQAEQLKRVLGDVAYKELLWETWRF